MIPDPILRLIIHGTPATAGSKSGFPIMRGPAGQRVFTGRVAVVESPSAKKKTWRQSVTETGVAAIRCDCGDPDCSDLKVGFPLDDPLVISMVFTVPKSKSAPKTVITYPDRRPDVLKYARATEDHLTAALVLTDDARVVEYGRMAKVFPNEDPDALPGPGARVAIWRRSQFGRGGVLVPSLLTPGTLFDLED